MIMNKPQRMIGTDRGDKRCGILPGKAACGMSESAERTPAPPGSVAQAAPTAQPGSAHVQGMRLRRRPTGTPPPLPHPIAVSTTAWVLLAVVIVACAFLFSEITPWRRVGDQANTWVLLRLADVRTPWLTDVANGINAAGTGWGIPAIGVSVVVLTEMGCGSGGGVPVGRRCRRVPWSRALRGWSAGAAAATGPRGAGACSVLSVITRGLPGKCRTACRRASPRRVLIMPRPPRAG